MTTEVPIVKTDMAHRIIRGGAGITRSKECWAARTLDGEWLFDRLDLPGTPWEVTHAATGIVVGLFGTLKACRRYVAAGHAQADVDRVQAHERGEHGQGCWVAVNSEEGKAHGPFASIKVEGHGSSHKAFGYVEARERDLRCKKC